MPCAESRLDAERQRLWRNRIYEQVRLMQAQGGLTIERMCQLGPVSRAGFYRHWQRREPRAEEMEVRTRIQEIVLRHRGHYGYRRVSWELRHQGLAVNDKRVLRLMQQDQLLAVRRRKFILTTEAGHDLPVCVNLAARLLAGGAGDLARSADEFF